MFSSIDKKDDKKPVTENELAPHNVSVWETPLKTVILFVIPSVGVNGSEFTHFRLRKYFNMGEKNCTHHL